MHQSRLYRDLIDSLSETQQQRFRGHGAPPSLRDASQEYLGTTYRDLFSPDFWNHFITQLPEFSDGLTGGIAFLPRGGVIGNTFAGVLVAKGNLVLADRARIRGLVLHLGDGALRLEGEARITGRSGCPTSRLPARLSNHGLFHSVFRMLRPFATTSRPSVRPWAGCHPLSLAGGFCFPRQGSEL